MAAIKTMILLIVMAQVVLAKIDMQIGAGGFGFGCGSNSPAVQVPFSYVRLGPDTTPLIKKEYFQFQHYGGYSTADHYLKAFSHMHLVGAGVIDLGLFGILPKKAKSWTTPPLPKDSLVEFYKSSEQAEPGYYRVDLEHDIRAQLTTTQRTGAHRYTFKQNSINNINVMTSYMLQKKAQRNSTTTKCGDSCIQGSVFYNGGFASRFGGLRVHFHMEWKADTRHRLFLFNDSSVGVEGTVAQGMYTGAVIQTNATSIQLYIGISYVSIENAKHNLKMQVPQLNFDLIRKQSQQIWARELSRFQVSALTPAYQTKFDTALYRTMLSPTLFSDYNRQYPSFRNDGTISKVPDDMGGVYTDMSIWDVHRTQMPWLLFQDLPRFNDIAKSIVLINREGGYMPKWPFANGWTGCMIGAHANTILADWIVKEANKNANLANLTQIMEYMLRNANTRTNHDDRPNPTQYVKLGYIPFEDSSRAAVSQTLELSFNDFSISQVASLMNMTQTAADFKNRSTFYKNLWNPKTKFFEHKFKNGTFKILPNRQKLNSLSNYYVEGDAWHYRFAVPHGGQQLIDLFGGNKQFVRQLSKFFEYSKYWPTFWLPNPYYWAGNEHDLFSVWLFSFANRSDLTAKYSRMILSQQYGVEGDGLPGNDDYATMSAWFVFAALGFYPLPSTENYILGSPVISSARIFRRKSDGSLQAFNIHVEQNKVGKYKVQSVNLQGKPLDRFIKHGEMEGSNSLLTFVMA